MSDQAPHEPNIAPETAYVTGNPAVNTVAGATILACVALVLALSLWDTPGSPHGASLALIVGGGILSAIATFHLARRDRRR